MLSISIDTVSADIGTASYFNAHAGAVVSADTVVLNGDFRWLSDFNAAAFIVVHVIAPDKQPLAAGKIDTVTCVVENCVVVYTSKVLVWSRAC